MGCRADKVRVSLKKNSNNRERRKQGLQFVHCVQGDKVDLHSPNYSTFTSEPDQKSIKSSEVYKVYKNWDTPIIPV